MYRITKTSTICVKIAAATVALILLTSATLTTSVYAERHHHGNRSIEDGYQTLPKETRTAQATTQLIPSR